MEKKGNQIESTSNTTVSWLTQSEDGVLINIHVQPAAKRDAVVGIYNERLKIALTAPPVDGKANEAVANFLAKRLHCAKRNITLIAGQTARTKRFRIVGVPLPEIYLALVPA